MKNITKLSLALFLIGLFAISCSKKVDESHKEEILEMEAVQDEIEDINEQIDVNVKDLEHDVDSLLEGI